MILTLQKDSIAGSLTQAWAITRYGHDRNYFLGHDRDPQHYKKSQSFEGWMGVCSVFFNWKVSYLKKMSLLSTQLVFQYRMGWNKKKS